MAILGTFKIVRHAGGKVKRACNGWETDKRMQVVNPLAGVHLAKGHPLP